MPFERGDSSADVGATTNDSPSTFEQATLGGTTTTGNARLVVRDATQIDIVDTNNYYTSTTVEGALDEVGADILSNDSDISSLQSQITSNDSDISALDSRVTANETDISDLILGQCYWGNIVGTLSNQTDLQAALDAKVTIDDVEPMTSTVADGASAVAFSLSSANLIVNSTAKLLEVANTTIPMFWISGLGNIGLGGTTITSGSTTLNIAGSTGGNIAISPNIGGFTSSAATIYFSNNTGDGVELENSAWSSTLNDLDLGTSIIPWVDLYLSGGIHFDPTGTGAQFYNDKGLDNIFQFNSGSNWFKIDTGLGIFDTSTSYAQFNVGGSLALRMSPTEIYGPSGSDLGAASFPWQDTWAVGTHNSLGLFDSYVADAIGAKAYVFDTANVFGGTGTTNNSASLLTISNAGTETFRFKTNVVGKQYGYIEFADNELTPINAYTGFHKIDSNYSGYYSDFGDFSLGNAGDPTLYLNYYTGTSIRYGDSANRQNHQFYMNTIWSVYSAFGTAFQLSATGDGTFLGTVSADPPTSANHLTRKDYVDAMTWDTSDIVSGTFADARIAESNVTQHEAALDINASQVTTTISTQTASYTLALTDAGDYVRMNVATANNLTVPPNSTVAFPTGTMVHIKQLGAGQTTVVAGTGVTINYPASLTLKLKEQHSVVTLVKVDTNTWDIMGHLEAA